jgi:hypothetical protein
MRHCLTIGGIVKYREDHAKFIGAPNLSHNLRPEGAPSVDAPPVFDRCAAEPFGRRAGL